MTTPSTSTAETLRRVLDSFTMDLHVALPGIVRSYDASTQTADVEPAVQRVLAAEDEDENEDAAERLPIIPAVPVAWPRAGGFFLHWPMEAGDSVLLVFSEADLNVWRESGGVVDPEIAARHALAGAVALPGLYPQGRALGDADATHGRLGREGGPFIEFRPDEIRAGGDNALAMAHELSNHLKQIELDLDSIATAAGVASTYDHDLVQAAPGGDYRTTTTKGA